MTCRSFIEFLWRYLGGELEPAEKVEFDRHLAECPPCVAYLQTYEQTVELEVACARLPDGPVPAEVPEELLQAVKAAVRERGGEPEH